MPDCPLCDRYFSSDKALIQHTEAKHGKTNVHRGVRVWEASRDQQGELTTGRAAGDYAYEVTSDHYDWNTDTWDCSICNREFSTKKRLEQHLNSGVHEADLYRCQGCSRTFRNLAALNMHVTDTSCSARAARQVRTLLGDASRQQGLLMITNQSSSTRQTAPPEGKLYFDGGASPNPGWGGAGFILYDDLENEVSRKSIKLMDYGVTNNQAEYVGLIAGLLAAENEGMRRVAVFGDSQLVINQMLQIYTVRSDKLHSLNTYANEIRELFQRVTYVHIARDRNTIADWLAQEGKYDPDAHMELDIECDPPVWYV